MPLSDFFPAMGDVYPSL